MRKDMIAVGVAVPVVAIIVLSMNHGKAVHVEPKGAASQQQGAASSAQMKSMETLCKALVGMNEAKVKAKLGTSYATQGGLTYYAAAKAGIKPPYAIAVSYKKKKAASAKVVTYQQ